MMDAAMTAASAIISIGVFSTKWSQDLAASFDNENSPEPNPKTAPDQPLNFPHD
jgi:hypothetical protein